MLSFKYEAARPGTDTSSLQPHSVVKISHQVSPYSWGEKYVLLVGGAVREEGRKELMAIVSGENLAQDGKLTWN